MYRVSVPRAKWEIISITGAPGYTGRRMGRGYCGIGAHVLVLGIKTTPEATREGMESNQVIGCKPDSPLRQDALRQEPESFKIPLLLRLVVSSLNLKVIGSAYG